ncbi:TrmB family transcriptional regulator [Patescibacteria group bacterium]
MEKIKTALTSIGLTETEIGIYLTGLNYPEISVNELEKQTRIKRTTIYHALNTLLQKGLVAKKGSEAKLLFSMTDPDNINRYINKEIIDLKNQQKEVEEILPLLKQRTKIAENKIITSQYEGIEGIKLVVEEALYCKSRRWDIIAPPKNFFSDFSQKYAQYFIETRKNKGISTRTLWELDKNRRALSAEEVKFRNPRILPKVMHGKFKSVIIIFDDKVAIISSFKEKTAILMQSKEVNETFAAMFEGLYQSAKEYQK